MRVARWASIVADRGYGTMKVYHFLRRQRILPSVPRRAPWKHKAAMKHREFVYVPEVDRYRCPQGKWLYRQEVTPQGLVHYRTHEYACRGCGYKSQCTRAARCTITRPVDMDTREWAEHYLPVLAHKPRAVAHAAVIARGEPAIARYRDHFLAQLSPGAYSLENTPTLTPPAVRKLPLAFPFRSV